MKGLKYKIIGISLILGITGFIVAIIIPTGDGGARQQAEEFLKLAMGAQNARIVYDAYEIQLALQIYYDANNRYPQTLTIISNKLSEFQDIDISSSDTYAQKENGESYVITFSLKDGRVFVLGPDQLAHEFEVEARTIPDDFKIPEEQIDHMIEQNKIIEEALRSR